MRSHFASTMQAADWFADALATPALAAAWADAVVGYWEAELSDGRIDPGEPLYLLDLAPARGRLAWLLLHALEERLPGSPAATLDYRYVASKDGDEGGEEAHAEWTWLAAKRRFTFARWRGPIGSTLLIADSGLAITGTANPVVLLAPGLFERQPSGLFAAHRGAWMRGRLAGEPDAALPEEQGDVPLTCEWQAMRTDAIDARCETLAVHYVAHLPSSALLLPDATLEMLDALNRFCARTGYLLLAAAHGVCTERQLRAGMLWPRRAWLQQDATQPVNFHALALYHKALAATVYQRQLADHGVVVHAAWWRAGQPPLDGGVDALRARLDAHHPDDSVHLAVSAEALADVAPPEILLTLLRQSHHDPRVLGRMVSGYGDRPLHLTDSELHAWRAALASVAERHVPDAADPLLDRQLGRLTMRLGHWGLARKVFRNALACRDDDVAAHHHLACCQLVTGHLDDAIAHAAIALELDPTHRACAALHRMIRLRDARWRSVRGYRPALARDRDLCIEPLCGGHVEALLSQLRGDPQIALMTGLPELASREQVLDWIGSESPEIGRCSYAVIHDDWGPVGVVSYRRIEMAAQFYFWIGAHAQGVGLGSRAARLLCAQAAADGVTDLFTSVYNDNVRSVRTLDRVGFERLIAATTDDELYYHMPLAEEAVPVTDRLALCARLYAAIDSRDAANQVELDIAGPISSQL